MGESRLEKGRRVRGKTGWGWGSGDSCFSSTSVSVRPGPTRRWGRPWPSPTGDRTGVGRKSFTLGGPPSVEDRTELSSLGCRVGLFPHSPSSSEGGMEGEESTKGGGWARRNLTFHPVLLHSSGPTCVCFPSGDFARTREGQGLREGR